MLVHRHTFRCISRFNFIPGREGGVGLGGPVVAVACQSLGPSAIDFQVSGELSTATRRSRSGGRPAISLSQFAFPTALLFLEADFANWKEEEAGEPFSS